MRREQAGSGPIGAEPDGSFHRRLFTGLRCGVLVIDAKCRLLEVNDQGKRILELAGPVEPGVPVEEVLCDHPQLARLLKDSFRMSNPPNRAEIEVRCRSDRGKTIGFTLSLVPGTDGAPSGAALLFKDLTQIERSEEQERLRDRLAALGQMAAHLAHEIRNPLASIEVTASLLRRRTGPDPAARELLDKITAEVMRLNQTVSAGLEFVKPLPFSPSPGRIEEILERALSAAIERHGREGIRVERRFPRRLPSVLVDAGQIRQVFQNIFLNALEAMGEQGLLVVEVAAPEPGGDALCVRVADTGPGIPEKDLQRLFYPFFTTKERGSGVGLAVVRKIVDGHGGMIDVANRPGGGALFTVHLPLAGPPSPKGGSS